MAVRRNHEHSHHCKTSRLSLPSSLSLSLAQPRVSSRSISLRKYPWRPASACTSLPQAGSLAIAGERSKGSPVEARIAESVEGWLRGLDSNQDIQLQRLACYRLHHPGIAANTELTLCNGGFFRVKRVNLTGFRHKIRHSGQLIPHKIGPQMRVPLHHLFASVPDPFFDDHQRSACHY